MLSDDDLVVMAERIIRQYKDRLKSQRSDGRSQLSKAIEVAKASRSFLVFKNWVRYQMAREKGSGGPSSDIWKAKGSGGRTMGEAVCQAASEIERSSSNREETIAGLIKFLGYLRRAFIGLDYLDRIPAAGGEG